MPPDRQSGLFNLVSLWLGPPVVLLLVVALPVSIAFSLLRYRLWDIDFIINMTLFYSLLTGSLGLLYIGSIVLLQWLILAFTEQASLTIQQSGGVLLASTLVIAALFRPWRRRIQAALDRRFAREQVDFQEAHTQLSRKLRTITDLSELLQILVNCIAGDLLQSRYGAIFLYDKGDQFQLKETYNLSLDERISLSLNNSELSQLGAGDVISRSKQKTFSLLLPLTAPGVNTNDLVGVLALGPRLFDQPYSRRDRTVLKGLADQAGTAISLVQSFEIERQLESHRNSALGRAEAMAQTLLVQPKTALIELHQLVQKAGQDAGAASLINNLPQTLDSLGAEPVARLAEGFNYIFNSKFSPELLPVGLRLLTNQLQQAVTSPKDSIDCWFGAPEALVVYRLCQMALEVDSIPQITLLSPLLQEQGLSATVSSISIADGWSNREQESFLVELGYALGQLQPILEALHAFERVETSEDKLFYLARAIEQLGRYCHQGSPGLALPERLILQSIIDHWTILATEGLQVLQGRAQLEFTLITRQLIAAEQVVLALELTNLGRSPALNIAIELLPGEGYEPIEKRVTIDRLPAGSSTQKQFAVQPTKDDTFTPYFRLSYDDRERSGKRQTVNAPVRLLAVPTTFTPISNPYAPGLPLRQDSPVFFGRENVFSFIQDSLDGTAAGGVLVITGQRRMGKTSLSQQLPVRLSDNYITVYLDGQSLAIDPGLPALFYDIAFEIAQALRISPPSPASFQDRAGAVFEREFLPPALEAAGPRQILLVFDEFEELEMRVASGRLDPELFPYLRHLMQHVDGLAFIFVGTHKLETLNPAYWSAFFNVALHRHVSFLDEQAARALIIKPVAPHLRYDDLALDKMVRATGGYPYFLQLLCHTLVGEANRDRRNYIALAHVNQALEQVLELAEAHFIFLWDQMTPTEQEFLRTAAFLSTEETVLTLDTLTKRLETLNQSDLANPGLGREAILDTLAALVQREILPFHPRVYESL